MDPYGGLPSRPLLDSRTPNWLLYSLKMSSTFNCRRQISATFVGVCEQAVSHPAFLLDPTPLSIVLTLLSSVSVLHITIIVIISTR